MGALPARPPTPGTPGHPVTATLCAFQNQLLTKGMVILRDKIRFYEGESGLVAGPECRATLPAGVAAGRCGQCPGVVAPR